MAYLKHWTDNFFQIFVWGTSWIAVSINNIKTDVTQKYQNFIEVNVGTVLPVRVSTGSKNFQIFWNFVDDFIANNKF